MRRTHPLNYCLTVAIFALLLSLCAGCVPSPNPRPKPGPKPSQVEQLCRDALSDYADGMAAAFAEAASNTPDDGATANQQLAAANKAAREKAFKSIDRLLNDSIGGEHYDADKAAQLFGQLSAAFEKVKPR